MSQPRILYTRAAVEQAASMLGDPRLVDAYFQGLQDAYEKVDTVLKDASYNEESA